MFQEWKKYILGAIALLASVGVFTLGDKLLSTSDTPEKNTPSISPKLEKATVQSVPPKPEKSTKKVRLIIRSEDEKELNEPIENVKVEFAVSNGSSDYKFTSYEGYVDIEIPQGVDVKIRLTHKDYLQRRYTLNLDTDPDKTKEYFLKRKPKANLSFNSIPSKPEPMISGVWKGKYTCSQGITGVTVAIAQTENKLIADFSLYPVPENMNVPNGLAKYEGDFNPTSRRMRFLRGTWINQPAPFWTAFGFQGQFDENLETFSGKVDHYSCGTINLKRKGS